MMPPPQDTKRNAIIWIKDAWHLSAPYWRSQNKYQSIGLLCLIILFNLAAIYMIVLFNHWYKNFYDALQHYNKPAFIHYLYQFMGMAILYIMFQVSSFLVRKLLEIKWRKWLTKYYLDNWLDSQSYYKVRFTQQKLDNPDQRISEDISGFISSTLDLTIGLLSAIVTLVSFIVILWTISGSFDGTVLGHHFHIQGYMVYVALIYAMIGTYFTFKIGKPLIKLNFQQQVYEANFRYGLMRIREYSENIAFYQGEHQEKTGLIIRFNNVVQNFVAIIYRQIKIDILGISYTQIAIIFPIVVASGRYFAKIIQLGDLMQITSAFGRVQESLSYFISAYSSLSNWRAIMDRLYGFQNIMHNANALQGIPITQNNSYLTVNNLSINLPNGDLLVRNLSITLHSGDTLLIKGRSGCGKTTVLRTIAGLWPFAQGNIHQNLKLTSMFIAQKPYIPDANLRDIVCYPRLTNKPDDTQIIKILQLCELESLSDKLDINVDWQNCLSLGEQQKITFCRILLTRPDIIYLDEVTSALDEETEYNMYQLLITQLPQSAIISIGHRSTIKQWHNLELNLNQYIK